VSIEKAEVKMSRPMNSELVYSPLVDGDVDELATALHNESVHKYIGGMPSRVDFELWLRQSLAGPPPEAGGEHWINVVVRTAETGKIIGRLEANVHDELAEVAFLYDPKLWGRGHASRGLLWLHDHLRQRKDVHGFWATAHPENQRCVALLTKCGYAPVTTKGLPVLHSYDEGDLVFTHTALHPAPQRPRAT
jgi:RimJ/RimL family protein N-acetyltransferase